MGGPPPGPQPGNKHPGPFPSDEDIVTYAQHWDGRLSWLRDNGYFVETNIICPTDETEMLWSAAKFRRPTHPKKEIGSGGPTTITVDIEPQFAICPLGHVHYI